MQHEYESCIAANHVLILFCRKCGKSFALEVKDGKAFWKQLSYKDIEDKDILPALKACDYSPYGPTR